MSLDYRGLSLWYHPFTRYDTAFTPSSYAFVPLQVAATADDLKTITSLLGAGDKPNFPGQAKQYDIQVARCPAHAIFEIAQLSGMGITLHMKYALRRVVVAWPGYSPTTKSPRLTMLACLLHPFSRGSIHVSLLPLHCIPNSIMTNHPPDHIVRPYGAPYSRSRTSLQSRRPAYPFSCAQIR